VRLFIVALNTFKENIRNRVMINILLFALALIMLSLVVGDWSMWHQVKVIKDFGLSAMSLFGLLIALFIGIRLMVQELEQHTIYIVASKPIQRWEILLGKFTGLAMTLLVNMALMTVALWVVDFVMEKTVDFGLVPAVVLMYVEILLMVAFAMLFSSIASPTLSAVFTITIFIIGHMSGFLRDYVQLYPDKGFHWVLRLIYWTAPNLENLNLKTTVVEHLQLPPHAFGYGLLYGLGYMFIILFVTAAVFDRRDLK
jgi:ABC-type transport system involved in multi-copper enzyme maturation permease subunit